VKGLVTKKLFKEFDKELGKKKKTQEFIYGRYLYENVSIPK